MRRVWRRVGAALLLVALALYFGPLPGWFEGGANRVAPDVPPKPVSAEAARLHARLVVVDLHIDTLLWRRPVWERAERGQSDLPRLAAGNVALGVHSSVSKTPIGQNYETNSDKTDALPFLAIAQLQPPATWFSPYQRNLWHAHRLEAARARAPELRIIRTRADLSALLTERAAGRPATGALLALEGMHGIGADMERLDRLFAAGYRMGGLTHFFDNPIAGSVHGTDKGGLTPFGRRVVAEMQARGMVVDLAHVSHAAIADVLAVSRRPVVVSHGGVKATCPNNRTLTDAEVRGIARTGGIVGIGLWDAAVCAADPAATARAMRHVRDIAGIGAVALGSDFDGSVATPIDVAGLAALTQALLDQGFSDTEVAAAMGGNAVRVLMATLPAG